MYGRIRSHSCDYMSNKQISINRLQQLVRVETLTSRLFSWLKRPLNTASIVPFGTGLLSNVVEALRRILIDLSECVRVLKRDELHYCVSEYGTAESLAVVQTLSAKPDESQQQRFREIDARIKPAYEAHVRATGLHETLCFLHLGDDSRRQLVADISHELRTPTSAIRSEVEVVLRSNTKNIEDYRDSFNRILKITAQLSRVIDDLVTVASCDTQSLVVKPQEQRVSSLVQEALQQVQALALQRRVSMVWDDLTSPDMTLQCDGMRLRQILVLLMDNAIRYSYEEAQVVLRTTVVANCWRADVIDHGLGISADELPHVFERHFRGEEARRHRSDGLGLGLSLARKLTDAHGGTLEVTSQRRLGTTVTLRVPFQKGKTT